MTIRHRNTTITATTQASAPTMTSRMRAAIADVSYANRRIVELQTARETRRS